VLVSYCPLCNSGVVYRREPDDLRQAAPLTFSNTSALYDNDLVMVDRETGTYWWQVAGVGIVGTLTGARLPVLPSTTTTWAQWLELHPDTFVLSRNTGFARDYTIDPFLDYPAAVDAGLFSFPVDEDALADDRLGRATRVVGVEAGTEAVAVPLEGGSPATAMVAVADGPIAVFTDGAGSGAAFFAGDDAFSVSANGWVDSATGSTWNLAGTAVAGERAGDQLEQAPSRQTFWFAYVAAFPGAMVVLPVG
ncbi:MAG: DUF3179 domain-containing protein, partial [Acidimicrobiia bacterium]|nr:DUF3179 domain-containing protein [Acidimicrobiia bacterium]